MNTENKNIILAKLKELEAKIAQMSPTEVYALLDPYLKQANPPSGTLLTEEFNLFTVREDLATAA